MKNMRSMRFAKTALKNLFSAPATRPYPEQPREYPERTRGHIQIDIDTCILCGLCSRKCPTGAITVNRAEKTWSIMRFGCIQCGCCVETCPKKCLTMMNTYTEPGAKKTEDTFIKTNMPAPPAKPAAAANQAQAAGTAAPAAGQPAKAAMPGAKDAAPDTQPASGGTERSAQVSSSAGQENPAADKTS